MHGANNQLGSRSTEKKARTVFVTSARKDVHLRKVLEWMACSSGCYGMDCTQGRRPIADGLTAFGFGSL